MRMTTGSQSLPIPPEAASDAACCGGQPLAAPTLDERGADGLASRLKALADPTRLRMLDLLAAQTAPLCVCEVTERFALSQPTISHHLRILREAGLVTSEKRGVWSYFGLTAGGRRALTMARALNEPSASQAAEAAG